MDEFDVRLERRLRALDAAVPVVGTADRPKVQAVRGSPRSEDRLHPATALAAVAVVVAFALAVQQPSPDPSGSDGLGPQEVPQVRPTAATSTVPSETTGIRATPNADGDPKASGPQPPATQGPRASATPGPVDHSAPYTTGQMAAVIDASLREHPAAVPEAVRPPEVLAAMAATFAREIRTYDGHPYQRIEVSAKCGTPPEYCEVSVQGMPAWYDVFTDVYLFEVYPATLRIALVWSSLGGLPPGLAEELSDQVLVLDTDRRIGERLFSGAWWLLTGTDRYELRYANPNAPEEPNVVVVFDRAAGRIVDIH